MRLAQSQALAKAMRRRDFIKGIAGSATVWPRAIRAQQTAIPVIGFLHASSAARYARVIAVQESAFGTKRTCHWCRRMRKADIGT
jgi:hypothetical protein